MADPERDPAAAGRGRWARTSTVVALLALSAVVAVLLVLDPAGGGGALRWVAVATLVVLNLGYGAVLRSRERAVSDGMRELGAARAAVAAERAGERALEAVHVAARSLSGSLALPDVVDRAVRAAAGAVDADGTELALWVHGELATVATWGRVAMVRGTRRDPDAVERRALDDGDAQLLGRGGPWGGGPPTLVAPVALPDRVIGLLRVHRDTDARPFGEADRLALALLAEHVALALRNATTHDRVQQRAGALEAAFGELADEVR